jgi:hypothetical protein
MLQDAMIIAGDAFRDATRRKFVVFLLLMIAVLQVAVFSLYGEISLGVHDKMLKDASLAMVSIVGLISALSIGFQVPRELRERTAMTLFAKPLGREAYLVGKVLGGAGISLMNMFVVAVGCIFVLNMNGLTDKTFVAGYFQSFILTYVGSIDVIALALLLSIFLSEGAVAIGSIVIYVVGNAAYMMSVSSSGLSAVGSILKYVLPNYFMLDIKTEAAAGLSTSMSYVGISAAYGIVYAVMVTALCITLFKGRDL